MEVPCSPTFDYCRLALTLPGEAKFSLSEDELFLFRLERLSLPPRGDRFPAGLGNKSASSLDPSASSSVKTLSHESEIRTAPPGFKVNPSVHSVRSNNTDEPMGEGKLGFASDASALSSSSFSFGSHSAIIVADDLVDIQ